MIRDVFYFGNKPNSHPKEKFAESLEDAIRQATTDYFWIINEYCDYRNFDWDYDFDFLPDDKLWTKDHINVWPSEFSQDSGTWLCPAGNALQKIYLDIDPIKPKIEFMVNSKKSITMFYVEKNNSTVTSSFDQIKKNYPEIKSVPYLNGWVETINCCVELCETDLLWILDSDIDYSNFNFDYYPDIRDLKKVHVFGTQWNDWGTTFIINKHYFPKEAEYVYSIRNLKYVKDNKTKSIKCVHDLYLIDHGNDESAAVLETLTELVGTVSCIKYNKNYLHTLKDLVETRTFRKEDYIWVCSSICDYTDFDFSYVCDLSDLNSVYYFSDQINKFGDTFFINVDKLREILSKLRNLHSLHSISPKYIELKNSPQRLPHPVFVVTEDTHTEFAKYKHNFPYALYITQDNTKVIVPKVEFISLWETSKNVISMTTGSTHAVIPKEAESYIKKELHAYRIYSPNIVKSDPLDIIFLSNGEKCAEENYQHLLSATKGISNRIVRVDGITGRAKAYHAAVQASNTPWAFMVFAKLKVNPDFDWDWQPDRMQIPKHYIFYATNPVNGLEYGHQAMIAYNKNIVLDNPGVGLDFTMDNDHAVIPANSGIATFNVDAFTTWRTAFREAIKLRDDTHIDSKERLNIWLTVGNSDFGEYSVKGANDAVSYYEEVNGEFEKLKLSYEWEWLKNRFNK